MCNEFIVRRLTSDFAIGEKAAKVKAIHQALLEGYGHRLWRPRLDPLSELIYTILSQNTSDVNRDRAYERLRRRFPTWERVRNAQAEKIAEAIRPGGLANIKAPRIKGILRTITERRGELSLDFICQMEIEEAKEWLGSLAGVGPKTTACVLLFGCGRPAFPVDTHVYRVSKRLGLISQKASTQEAQKILEDILSPQDYYAFHLNLIAHGREVCQARRPRCEICLLAPHCDYLPTGSREMRGVGD